jgi:hypothetical protein
MGWSRRAFAASVTLALAGCAGARSDDAATEDDPATREDPATEDDAAADAGRPGGDDPDPVMDQPVSKWESDDPLEWWARVPDLTVLNAGTDGVTAYLAIYGPNWIETQFRETVSLRGHVAGEPAARVSFQEVDVVGASGVLAVETADGLSNAHPWDGAGDRSGMVVRLHDDRIGFADVQT